MFLSNYAIPTNLSDKQLCNFDKSTIDIISDKSTLHNYVDLSDLKKLCQLDRLDDRYRHKHPRETSNMVSSY